MSCWLPVTCLSVWISHRILALFDLWVVHAYPSMKGSSLPRWVFQLPEAHLAVHRWGLSSWCNPGYLLFHPGSDAHPCLASLFPFTAQTQVAGLLVKPSVHWEELCCLCLLFWAGYYTSRWSDIRVDGSDSDSSVPVLLFVNTKEYTKEIHEGELLQLLLITRSVTGM